MLLYDTERVFNYTFAVMPRNLCYLTHLYVLHACIMYYTCIIHVLKNPDDHFDINNFISFSTSNTRSKTSFKLKHCPTSGNLLRHSYFNRIPRLWNSLPPIDPNSPPQSIKKSVTDFLISNFESNFDSYNPCTYHFQCPCSSCLQTPSISSF